MAQTGAYFVAAYIAAGAVYTGYVLSLWWRSRRYRK